MAAILGAAVGHTYLRKELTLTVGGRTVSHTSYKRTVAQALTETGVTLKPTDEVSPASAARLTKSMQIVVRQAVPVILVADDRVSGLESAAATVGALLARRGVVLGATDTVSPGAATALVRGMTIRVVRIQQRVVTEVLRIPFAVQASQDPAAPRGMLRILRPGRIGLKERLYQVTVANGVVVRKALIGERLVRTPLDRVIRIGTLAQNASRGPFAGREYLDMVATAYSPFCCPGVHDVTAMGMKADSGVVAVDPTVIPLGSRVYIDGYGYAIAGDVGGAIKGLRIDLGFSTKRAALRYGVRRVRVYVLPPN